MVRNLPLVKLVGRQSVSRRAKGASSLKRKLEDRGILDAPDIETIKDLAGARVILYTNSDVDAFLKRRIIPEIFKIHWDEVKAHPKNRRGYGPGQSHFRFERAGWRGRRCSTRLV